jgi:hypothetical protein
MREEIKSGQAEMRSTLTAWIVDMKDDGNEIMSYQVTTAAEHREVFKEQAAVETGKAPSKQHRDRNLAAGRSGKLK